MKLLPRLCEKCGRFTFALHNGKCHSCLPKELHTPITRYRCAGCGNSFTQDEARTELLDQFCIHCWKQVALRAARGQYDWRYKFPWAA